MHSQVEQALNEAEQAIAQNKTQFDRYFDTALAIKPAEFERSHDPAFHFDVFYLIKTHPEWGKMHSM